MIVFIVLSGVSTGRLAQVGPGYAFKNKCTSAMMRSMLRSFIICGNERQIFHRHFKLQDKNNDYQYFINFRYNENYDRQNLTYLLTNLCRLSNLKLIGMYFSVFIILL